MTHICINNVTIIGSDNGLSPGRCQAIIWTNAGILLIGPLGTYFSEILVKIQTFSLRKMHLKMSSGKWRPFWRGHIVLTNRFHPYPRGCSTGTKNITLLPWQWSNFFYNICTSSVWFPNIWWYDHSGAKHDKPWAYFVGYIVWYVLFFNGFQCNFFPCDNILNICQLCTY